VFDRKSKAGRGTVVEYVKRISLEADYLSESIDRLRDSIEG
jgi:hypothetical protein